MRKFLAGAVAITMVSALPSSSQRDSFRRTTRSRRRTAVAQAGNRGLPQAGVDDLPNPLRRSKRRDMRDEAITGVLNGELTAGAGQRQHGRQGLADADQAAAPLAAAKASKAAQGPVRRAGQTSDRPDLRDPRRVRQRAAPGLPRPGHRPGHRRPGRRSTDRCTTRSPSRTGRQDNSTVWQADYNQAYYQNIYFGTGARTSSR